MCWSRARFSPQSLCISHFSHHNLWKVAFFPCCLFKYMNAFCYNPAFGCKQTTKLLSISFFIRFFWFVLSRSLESTERVTVKRIFYSLEFRRFHFVFLFGSYVNTPENLSIWQRYAPITNSTFKLFNNAHIQKVWHIYRIRAFIHSQRTQIHFPFIDCDDERPRFKKIYHFCCENVWHINLHNLHFRSFNRVNCDIYWFVYSLLLWILLFEEFPGVCFINFNAYWIAFKILPVCHLKYQFHIINIHIWHFQRLIPKRAVFHPHMDL